MLDEIGLYDPSFISSEDYKLWFRAMHYNYKFGNFLGFLVNIGTYENKWCLPGGIIKRGQKIQEKLQEMEKEELGI